MDVYRCNNTGKNDARSQGVSFLSRDSSNTTSKYNPTIKLIGIIKMHVDRVVASSSKLIITWKTKEKEQRYHSLMYCYPLPGQERTFFYHTGETSLYDILLAKDLILFLLFHCMPLTSVHVSWWINTGWLEL